LFGAGMNWSEILACAIEHKLTPTLFDRLRALDHSWLESDQLEVMAEIARMTGRNNLAYLSEMLRLYALFENAKILAIPFKGPALAWLTYPNFAQRTCVDLDFVVPQLHIPQAVALLQGQGYKPQFDLIEAQAGDRRPAPGQYAFAPSVGGAFVELHTERTLRYFSHPLNLEELNLRAIELDIGGQKIRSFSGEDLLVMLSVHGAKHLWERFSWIVDIAQLVSTRNVNWESLFEIAAQVESTRLLLLGLYLAHEMIGTPLPPSVLERARGDAHVEWLACKVFEQYVENSDSEMGVLPRALFRLRSSDGFLQGLRQLIRVSLSPTESDRETIQLPGFLSSLYALVRPIRLLGEYGLGLNRKLKPDLAIYQPTPFEVIEQMLRLANVSPGDVLYDLGCGDGRIVVAAAEKFGIRAVGVDINPTRIAEARVSARRHGVEKLAQFILGDAKKADLADATVITMYLGADGNLRLLDQLRSQLRPGARIVSRDFQIYGWAPESVENHIMPNGVVTSLFLWIIKDHNRELPETTRDSSGTAVAR
jgi:SAM-dependent methyltransferase